MLVPVQGQRHDGTRAGSVRPPTAPELAERPAARVGQQVDRRGRAPRSSSGSAELPGDPLHLPGGQVAVVQAAAGVEGQAGRRRRRIAGPGRLRPGSARPATPRPGPGPGRCPAWPQRSQPSVVQHRGQASGGGHLSTRPGERGWAPGWAVAGAGTGWPGSRAAPTTTVSWVTCTTSQAWRVTVPSTQGALGSVGSGSGHPQVLEVVDAVHLEGHGQQLGGEHPLAQGPAGPVGAVRGQRGQVLAQHLSPPTGTRRVPLKPGLTATPTEMATWW